MDNEKLLQTLKEQIGMALGQDLDAIQLDSTIVTDLGAESIDLVDLTFRLEKVFSITIPQGELFEAKGAGLDQLTVQDILAYVEKKTATTS